MARTVRPPVGNDFDFPPTSGALTGWTSMLLATAGIVWTLVNRHDVVAARLVTGLALFALVCYAYLLRPRIRVVDDVLHLVNPFEDVRIPLHVVSRVTVRSATNVYVGSKRYVGVAVGRKLRQMASPQGVGSGGISPLGLRMGRTMLSGSEPPGPDQKLPDLLEEWVGSRASLARSDRLRDPGDRPVPAGESVQRTRVWWLLSLSGGLALAFVVACLL